MKFRNKANQLICKNLFQELSSNKDQVIYTLAREDNKYPSIYKLYIESADLVEYNFATKYFENFQHWKKICQLPVFQAYISEWREELELLIRSKALSSLIKRSEQSTEIAKYLLNNNWVSKLHENNPAVNLRGRPSKQEIKNHLTLISNNALKEQDDYERIKNL